MKSRWVHPILILCLAVPVLHGQQTTAAAIPADNPVAYEVKLFDKLHDQVKKEGVEGIVELLRDSGAASDPMRGERGVLIAKRAASLCGWLSNDNDYERAVAVGTAAVKILDDYKEIKTPMDVERAYWQAVILGRTLNHYDAAVDLLEAAREVAPDDTRLLELEYQFVRRGDPTTDAGKEEVTP